MKQIYIALLLLSSLGLSAQNELYFTSFATPAQQADWEQYRLGGEQSPFYLWEISNSSGYDDTNSLVHYYPVGANDTTDDWYVSPEFQFEEGGHVDSLWTKYGGFGTPMTIDTVALYLIEGSKDPALATAKTLLHLFTDTAYKNDNTWRRIDSIEIPISTQKAYLAFRYTTENNWLDVQFDDIHVTAYRGDTNQTSISNTAGANVSFTIYPNPVQHQVSIDFGKVLESAQVRITDSQGKEVANVDVAHQDKAAVALHGPAGVYFVTVTSANGHQTYRVVKE